MQRLSFPSFSNLPKLPISDRTKKILVYFVAYPAFFLLSLTCGAYWTFPYDHLREYLIQEAERDGTTQLEIDELGPSWLTGVELEGVRYASVPENPVQRVSPLVVQEATVRVSILPLVVGTQDVSFDLEFDDGGTIEGEFAQSGEESTHIEAELENVNLRRLGPLHDMVGLPMSGVANGTVDLTVAQEMANTEGSADVTITGLSIGDGQTPLVIEGLGAGLTLARMNLGTARFRMETERGVSNIRELRANGPHAALRGSGSLRLIQPLRLSSMDMLLRVQFKDAYRESSDRMRAIFQLMELNPRLRPARTSDGSFQWRIQGSFAGRVRMIPAGQVPMGGGAAR